MSRVDCLREDSMELNQRLRRIRQEIHSQCVVCGKHNLRGLQLDFRVLMDGSVQADFECRGIFAGYPHTLHGGVICSLLDGAMTNCLFARGCVAVTAEIRVRFLCPVETERLATVRAWYKGACHQLHHLAANLQQDGQIMATATAKFLERVKEE
jgi:acyl-coenzyme A thioesterase PaaI-like protein